MIKPLRTLIFMASVLAVLMGIMAVFPEKGIRVTGNFKLQFPTLKEFIGYQEEEEDKPDMSLILNMKLDTASDEMVDSTEIKRKLSLKKAKQDSIRKALMRIQFPEGQRDLLYPFFRKLDALKSGKDRIRILHYGDSQVEGDRITGYIRYHLQRRFGGYGPGLIPAVQPIPSIAILQTASENFKRYTLFGIRDTTVKHNRYGVMMSFSRFTPILPDTAALPEEPQEAWLTLTRSRSAYENCKKYDYVKMYYSHNRAPVMVSAYLGDQLMRTDTLAPSTGLREKRWDFNETPVDFTLKFSGPDSPDIYALSADSKTGLSVDNIPMRGSAGTVFTKLDQDLLQDLFDDLDPELLILQFGGNVMPYMDDEKDAMNYGKSFAYQIKRLRTMRPGISIIVIGPSDMSIKEKDKYVTYPNLEKVRDELKRAAFESGACYWDLFEVMGGKNSMPLWVNTDPPLAATDYIHFSPQGARKVAELFYSALVKEYEHYEANNP